MKPFISTTNFEIMFCDQVSLYIAERRKDHSVIRVVDPQSGKDIQSFAIPFVAKECSPIIIGEFIYTYVGNGIILIIDKFIGSLESHINCGFMFPKQIGSIENSVVIMCKTPISRPEKQEFIHLLRFVNGIKNTQSRHFGECHQFISGKFIYLISKNMFYAFSSNGEVVYKFETSADYIQEFNDQLILSSNSGMLEVRNIETGEIIKKILVGRTMFKPCLLNSDLIWITPNQIFRVNLDTAEVKLLIKTNINLSIPPISHNSCAIIFTENNGIITINGSGDITTQIRQEIASKTHQTITLNDNIFISDGDTIWQHNLN